MAVETTVMRDEELLDRLASAREKLLREIRKAIKGQDDVVEQVLLSLKRAGLLTSRRGSAGGYHLTPAPEAITVGAVLRAVEGRQSPFEAGAAGNGGGDQELAGLWAEITEAVSEVVDRVTFGELVARVLERRRTGRAMYHI